MSRSLGILWELANVTTSSVFSQCFSSFSLDRAQCSSVVVYVWYSREIFPSTNETAVGCVCSVSQRENADNTN